MSQITDFRIRIAAIRFLNPAPLMWDFEHPPLASALAERYRIDWMLPSECADRLATGKADVGLVPIASLATTPGLRILPGCVIASKKRVRSLILARHADQPLSAVRSVAADMASRTTLAHTRLLFRRWGNPDVPFLPMAADLDKMLDRADAAILIGDPALLALDEQTNFEERTGLKIVYHDLADEWRAATGLPWVSAVWAMAPSATYASELFGTHGDEALAQAMARDFIASRDHGLSNVEALAQEWAGKIFLTHESIQEYFTENIHYTLDEECRAAMQAFFRMAHEAAILPEYQPQW